MARPSQSDGENILQSAVPESASAKLNLTSDYFPETSTIVSENRIPLFGIML